MSEHFDGHVVLNVSKFVKRIRSELKKTEFNAGYPIFILLLLKEFGDACDSIGVHKGTAICLFSHVMKKLVSLSLSSRLL